MAATSSLDAPAWLLEGRLRPRVILLGAARDTELRSRLRTSIEQHADIVLTDFEGRRDLSDVPADLVVVMGGDGSILHAARQMGTRQLPVLGVNLGKLGFLAALPPEDLAAVFEQVCAGRFEIVDHLMLRCTVHGPEGLLHEQLGLNEAAVLGGPPFSILNVDLYVDAILATTYSCDGLIISTPVGSTAHSLSAGGPILRKSLQAFVISPISPHTLTVRPVVDSADRVFEMVVREPNEATSVVVDGRVLCHLEPAQRVRVERAAPSFRMIEAVDQNYYRTLRDKLGWGGNIRGTSR